MRLIERVLTPRGRPQLPALTLPGEAERAGPCADENVNPGQTPRSKGSRLGKLLSRVLTPRRQSGDADNNVALQTALTSARPRSAGAVDVQRTVPSLRRKPAGLADGQLRLADSPAPLLAPGARLAGESDDAASEADSDLSSLDGFGEYAREHRRAAEDEEEEGSCSGGSYPDQLP